MTSQNEYASGDGQQLDEVIAEYLRAEAVGQAGNAQQWLDHYPTCAAGLAEFFDNRQLIGQVIVPLRSEQPTMPLDIGANNSGASLRLSAEFDTIEFNPQPPRLCNTRYRPLRFHARGGMGEIWLAEDELVGRQVAVKKLRTGRDTQRARFLVEAQITGQLEHPSIVPLHDLGMDEGGHPFYVMKFIQGRRLGEVIAQYHTQKSSFDWPSDVEFRALLEKFANVCNVVAYAHSKGVLHRDIKPDNVMFGPYGEVVVLDWGLAKVIGQTDEAGGRNVRLSGEGSTATQDGAIVGSPYYMSPEGAKGQPEAVDQSSDVYLLGATLYQILTGEPPRKGLSNWELIDLALHSRPADPRKVDARIPRAIEAVCLKAMAFNKQDRYPTPLALAEDVQKFLAGQPTLAYREPLSTRVARWLRRHRRGIVRCATVAGVLLLATFALHSYRQALLLTQSEQARQQLSEFHRFADEAQFFAANSDAISERVPYYDPGRAQSIGKSALAIAAPWGEEAQHLPLPGYRTAMLQDKYSLLLLMANGALREGGDKNAPREALAFLDTAKTVQPPSRGYYQLHEKCLALLGDRDAARQDEEQAKDPTTPVTAQDHFLQGELFRAEDKGSGAATIGDDEAPPTRDHLTRAVAEYRQALALDPKLYWARFQLGRCLLALGRAPEAIETLSTCIALRPNSPWAYSARGLANSLAGNSEDALRDLNRALELDPEFYPAQLNRGVVYLLEKKVDAAKWDFAAVLAAPADDRLMEAAYYRGQLLLNERHDREALADFSSVIEALPQFRPAYWLRAEAQFGLGNNDAGMSDLRRFLDLADPASTNASQSELSIALGMALRRMAQECDGEFRSRLLTQSFQQFELAIASGTPAPVALQNLGAVHELLNQSQPAIEAYSQGLALAPDSVSLHNMRGWAYVNTKKYEFARADFTEAQRLAPTNPESHAGLGYVLVLLGSTDDARNEASAALLTGSDNHLALHNVACIYGRLSEVDPNRRVENENLALVALSRAALVSRQHPRQPGADEVVLIRKEVAFPDSLRSRPEFKRLLVEMSDGRD